MFSSKHQLFEPTYFEMASIQKIKVKGWILSRIVILFCVFTHICMGQDRKISIEPFISGYEISVLKINSNKSGLSLTFCSLKMK